MKKFLPIGTFVALGKNSRYETVVFRKFVDDDKLIRLDKNAIGLVLGTVEPINNSYWQTLTNNDYIILVNSQLILCDMSFLSKDDTIA